MGEFSQIQRSEVRVSGISREPCLLQYWGVCKDSGMKSSLSPSWGENKEDHNESLSNEASAGLKKKKKKLMKAMWFWLGVERGRWSGEEHRPQSAVVFTELVVPQCMLFVVSIVLFHFYQSTYKY